MQKESQLHLSWLRPLAEEEDGTGGSQGEQDACTAPSQALAAVGAASSQRCERPCAQLPAPLLSDPQSFLFTPTFLLPRQRWEVEAESGESEGLVVSTNIC